MLSEGEIAPDFTLEGAHGSEIETFTLSETLTDRPVVLSFYIYDFSPICTEQLCELDDMEFFTFNEDVAVFGISTDGPFSHREFAKRNDLTYPLLTDKFGDVYEQYGISTATEDGERELTRGIVVVDSDCTVRYRWLADDKMDGWRVTPLDEAQRIVKQLSET